MNIELKCHLQDYSFEVVACSADPGSTSIAVGDVFETGAEIEWYPNGASEASVSFEVAQAGESLTGEYSHSPNAVTVTGQGTAYTVSYAGGVESSCEFKVWNPFTTKTGDSRPTLILLPKPGTGPTAVPPGFQPDPGGRPSGPTRLQTALRSDDGDDDRTKKLTR